MVDLSVEITPFSGCWFGLGMKIGRCAELDDSWSFLSSPVINSIMSSGMPLVYITMVSCLALTFQISVHLANNSGR